MKNILKFGLMSAVTAVALAQTPATTQSWEEDDVLAIASRGALSDSMQGFRKLADDEAGSIFGGVSYNYKWFDVGVKDNSGTIQYYRAYYDITLNPTESSRRRIDIGSGLNPADYTTLKFIDFPERNEFVSVEVSYVRGSGTSHRVVRVNPYTRQVIPVTYMTDFTSRLARHASTRTTNFENDKRNYFRGW